MFHTQPLKAIYVTYQLTSLLLRVPLWLLLAIPRSWRARSSWSIKRTVLVKLVRAFGIIIERTGPLQKTPNHLSITPGADVNGVWVSAVPHLVIGDVETWAKAVSVTSIKIPGYWMHKTGETMKVASPPIPGEKVLYALHGGGYVRMSAHPRDLTANIARSILEHGAPIRRAFSIEYRLSSHKPFEIANPFPAALIDALAGYNYLVNDVGFAPADILVEGDSAGGNLAHALVRHLTENRGTVMPAPPGGLILLSPWCDLGPSHDLDSKGSLHMFADADFLNAGSLPYQKTAFTGSHGVDFATKNRYISPASRDPSLDIEFNGFPRTFIVAGAAELLYDQIRTMKDRMVKDLGEGDGVKEDEGKVRYHEAPDAVHDYLVFDWFEPQRTDTLKAIAKWVEAASTKR